MKRILVCGGRDYTNKKLIYKTLDAALGAHGSVIIISGMARGADIIGWQWAKDNNQEVLEFPITKEDWDRLGKRAGPMRNQQMLDDGKPELVIAFPGGNGTADMVARSKKAHITVVKIHDNSPPVVIKSPKRYGDPF